MSKSFWRRKFTTTRPTHLGASTWVCCCGIAHIAAHWTDGLISAIYRPSRSARVGLLPAMSLTP